VPRRGGGERALRHFTRLGGGAHLQRRGVSYTLLRGPSRQGAWPQEGDAVDFEFSPEERAFAEEVEKFLDENHDPEVMDPTRENFSQLVDTPPRAPS